MADDPSSLSELRCGMQMTMKADQEAAAVSEADSGVRIYRLGFLTPETLYEKVKSEPQNRKISNVEVWNRFRLRLRLRPDRSLSLH